MVFDDLDLRLLQELQRDARASHRALAAKLGTTTPTVGARIQRLQETGVLQGVTPSIPQNAISGTLWTVMAKAPAAAQKALIADLQDDPDVERVMVLSGGRLLILLRPASQQAIGKLEARLDELGATSHDAWAVTGTPIDRQPDLSRHSAIASCAQCHGPIHGDGDSARLDGRRIWFCCAQCKAAFLARHASMQGKAKKA